MTSQPTPVRAPKQLQIADDLRMQIERGELAPGDALPPLHELAERWSCSFTSARNAISLLKQQGLITGGRGLPPTVRGTPHRAVRSSTRHQAEKDLVLASESERRLHGEAEENHGMNFDQTRFQATYSEISADDANLARVFNCPGDTRILRKLYQSWAESGTLLAESISYLPIALIESNPVLLTSDCEPWPGGTQHQLYTVGIEIGQMIDEVTARMPTTVDMERWDLPEGVPLLSVRRISVDTNDRIVEVSDAQYPADRTELRFVTPLKPLGK